MKFDPYEYTGIILPGSVVVLAVALLFPEVKELLGKEGIASAGWAFSLSHRSSWATSFRHSETRSSGSETVSMGRGGPMPCYPRLKH